MQVHPGQCSSSATLDTQTSGSVQSHGSARVVCTVFSFTTASPRTSSSFSLEGRLNRPLFPYGILYERDPIHDLPRQLPSRAALPGIHMDCATPDGDCPLSSREQFSHWAFESYCFLSFCTIYPYAPNTCIGGSGAGAMQQQSHSLDFTPPAALSFSSPSFALCWGSVPVPTGNTCCCMKSAPNTCIGGSGARATSTPSNVDPILPARIPRASSSSLFDLLASVGLPLVVLCRSAALAVLLLLLALLAKPKRRQSLLPGCLFLTCCHGLPMQALKAFAFTLPNKEVLDWRRHKNKKGRPKLRTPCHAKGALCSVLWWWFCLSLPELVHACWTPRAVWILAPTVGAMTRTPRPDDPPGLPRRERRPHLIPPRRAHYTCQCLLLHVHQWATAGSGGG